MLRHVIAPAHSYAQIPNAILRHPRLSPDAKTLLNWQLSLPASEEQCLSDTARRAGIKKCAFQKAKRQLLDEGYLHQWTTRADGGRFVTIQLVANTALSAKEALAVRDGLQPAPGGAQLTRRAEEPPTDRKRTPRRPTGPAVGRLPEENTGENTTQPTGAQVESTTEAAAPTALPDTDDEGSRAETSSRLAAAEALLLSLRSVEPQLAMPARTARRWAPLAAKWLEADVSPLRMRHVLTDGIADTRKPLGALRWRLEHALPEPPPPPTASPQPTHESGPRTTAMRECRTRHTQPRLFTPPPGTDEDLCPDCRLSPAPSPEPTPESSGYAAFLAARRDNPTPRSRPRRKHDPANRDHTKDRRNPVPPLP